MSFFEGFVNPALVGGVALAAVPLIIHLLNRQRHRPISWAAMRFVLAAYRKTRRRVQLENLLLLLLRMAAIAALAFAVSRPFTGAESPFAGLTESRRDIAIVIDASASTGYREDVDTVYERIVARARELVEGLDGERGDRAHLVLGGAWPRLVSWGDPVDGLAMLETLNEPTDERMNLAGALGLVLDFAREEAASTDQSRVEVYLLTDLQRGSFVPTGAGTEAAGNETDSLADVLEGLEALGLEVRVEDLGPAEPVPANLAVTELAPERPIVGTGSPVDLRVTVANHGSAPKLAVRVALELDGERRPSQLVDVPGRSTADAVFPVIFDTSGDHVARAILEGDRLAADDTRVQVLHVPDPLRVLVVNGAPAGEVELDAAARLLIVLEPSPLDDGGPTAVTPFLPTEARPLELESGDVDLANFDVIWLAGVDSLSPEATERLEQVVAAGASLVLSMGERVILESFNNRFFRADGTGLSPAQLVRRVAVASRRESYYRVKAFEAEHPALALFAEERWKALLTEAPFYEFVDARPLESARVLAEFDNPGSSPLLVERAFDRGKVFLWTSTIDESWTALPTWGPALVPLVYDLVRYAGSEETAPSSLSPGDSFVAEVASFPRRIELVLPGGSRRTLDDQPEEIAHDRWRLPAVEGSRTARAGLYLLETDSAGTLAFAVQLEASESDLERALPGELEGRYPALVLAAPEEESVERDDGLPRRGELWRFLALAALFALVGESLWAAWIGRRRRI